MITREKEAAQLLSKEDELDPEKQDIEEENEEEKTERISDIRAKIKGGNSPEETKAAARKWKARRGLLR